MMIYAYCRVKIYSVLRFYNIKNGLKY